MGYKEVFMFDLYDCMTDTGKNNSITFIKTNSTTGNIIEARLARNSKIKNLYIDISNSDKEFIKAGLSKFLSLDLPVMFIYDSFIIKLDCKELGRKFEMDIVIGVDGEASQLNVFLEFPETKELFKFCNHEAILKFLTDIF